MANSDTKLGAHLVDEEESYFVSMTDMMVGVIFIFVILLMTFALSFREAEVVRKAKVDQLQIVDDARKKILEDIEQSLTKAGVPVKIDIDNGILRLPEEILFSSGSANLSAQGKESLRKLAQALYAVVPCYSAGSEILDAARCKNRMAAMLDAILIEGHTDNIPVGNENPFHDNWNLSAQRAIETYKNLTSIEPALAELMNEMSQKLFSVSGYGEFRPIADNSTEEERKKNRRIDLRFLMKTPRSQDLEVAEGLINQGIVQDASETDPHR